ncbi:hypothetical protein PENSPDRAFT_333257 [Peniophora sp. CONT]|nr:hypothetical protein PENSPDRAFT_333257 [Peniophora sp. CONT]
MPLLRRSGPYCWLLLSGHRILHLATRRLVLEGLHRAATYIPAPTCALTRTERIRLTCHSTLHGTVLDATMGTKANDASQDRERESVVESDSGRRALWRRLSCMRGKGRFLYGSRYMPGIDVPPNRDCVDYLPIR